MIKYSYFHYINRLYNISKNELWKMNLITQLQFPVDTLREKTALMQREPLQTPKTVK